MYKKLSKQDLKLGTTSKYLKGLDFKGILIEEAKKHIEIQNQSLQEDDHIA